MAELEDRLPGRASCVHNAIVGVFVHEHCVVPFGQGLDQNQASEIPGAEVDGVVFMEECPESGFHFEKGRVAPEPGTGGGAVGPEPMERPDPGPDDGGMAMQSEKPSPPDADVAAA